MLKPQIAARFDKFLTEAHHATLSDSLRRRHDRRIMAIAYCGFLAVSKGALHIGGFEINNRIFDTDFTKIDGGCEQIALRDPADITQVLKIDRASLECESEQLPACHAYREKCINFLFEHFDGIGAVPSEVGFMTSPLKGDQRQCVVTRQPFVSIGFDAVSAGSYKLNNLAAQHPMVSRQLRGFVETTAELLTDVNNPYLPDILGKDNLVVGSIGETPGLFLVDQSLLEKERLESAYSIQRGVSDLTIYHQRLEQFATTMTTVAA